MRYDASDTAEGVVNVDIVADLLVAAGRREVILVGAAARDIIVGTADGTKAKRSTSDTDVAIAMSDLGDLEVLCVNLGAQRSEGIPHRFVYKDATVDVLPFGEIEQTPGETEFGDGTTLDVTGLREAAASADEVHMPKSGLVLRVASIEMLCVLKLMAWRDRGGESEHKDAGDLALLLVASSEGMYAEAGF